MQLFITVSFSSFLIAFPMLYFLVIPLHGMQNNYEPIFNYSQKYAWLANQTLAEKIEIVQPDLPSFKSNQYSVHNNYLEKIFFPTVHSALKWGNIAYKRNAPCYEDSYAMSRNEVLSSDIRRADGNTINIQNLKSLLARVENNYDISKIAQNIPCIEDIHNQTDTINSKKIDEQISSFCVEFITFDQHIELDTYWSWYQTNVRMRSHSIFAWHKLCIEKMEEQCETIESDDLYSVLKDMHFLELPGESLRMMATICYNRLPLIYKKDKLVKQYLYNMKTLIQDNPWRILDMLVNILQDRLLDIYHHNKELPARLDLEYSYLHTIGDKNIKELLNTFCKNHFNEKTQVFFRDIFNKVEFISLKNNTLSSLSSKNLKNSFAQLTHIDYGKNDNIARKGIRKEIFNNQMILYLGSYHIVCFLTAKDIHKVRKAILAKNASTKNIFSKGAPLKKEDWEVIGNCLGIRCRSQLSLSLLQRWLYFAREKISEMLMSTATLLWSNDYVKKSQVEGLNAVLYQMARFLRLYILLRERL